MFENTQERTEAEELLWTVSPVVKKTVRWIERLVGV